MEYFQKSVKINQEDEYQAMKLARNYTRELRNARADHSDVTAIQFLEKCFDI